VKSISARFQTTFCYLLSSCKKTLCSFYFQSTSKFSIRPIGLIKYGIFGLSGGCLLGGERWRKKYGISHKILDLATLFGSIRVHATLYYARTRLNILHTIMHTFTLRILYAVLCCAGDRTNDFVVGLMNVSPLDSKPIMWNYTLCGQYPGEVPLGATVMLPCHDNLPLFRYVVVHFPSSRIVSVCEIQVLVKGMPDDACRAEHCTVQALWFKLQWFDLLQIICDYVE